MRKKTLQQELEEIKAEREEVIKQLSKKTGHSQDHIYDFNAKYKAQKNAETDEEEQEQRLHAALQKHKSRSKHVGVKVFFGILCLIPCFSMLGVISLGFFLMISSGILPLMSQLKYVDVTAIVESVEVIEEENDFYAHINVSFEYEGEAYQTAINELFNQREDIPQVEDRILIKVNYKNPNEAQIKSEGYAGQIICIVIGGIMVFACIFGIVKLIRMLIAERSNKG